MRIKLLVDNPRLNEMAGVLALLLAIGILLCLVSYSPADPSVNVATPRARPVNWMGLPGSFGADLILQSIGLAGFLVPAGLALLALKLIRNVKMDRLRRRAGGWALLTVVLCCSLQLLDRPVGAVLPSSWESTVRAGGALGKVLTDGSTSVLNLGGTILLLLACTSISVYTLTSLRVANLLERREKPPPSGDPNGDPSEDAPSAEGEADAIPLEPRGDGTLDTGTGLGTHGGIGGDPPWDDTAEGDEDLQAPPLIVPYQPGESTLEGTVTGGDGRLHSTIARNPSLGPGSDRPKYKLPPTSLLNPRYQKEPYNEVQLQETAQQIVMKFEEFRVAGTIDKISPGPVVTTFEFKPDRGIKYSKIVNLSEDLCLALECESVLVERLPGKSTIGIEVPNKRREVISLREVVEWPAFRKAESMLTFALGKDISGNIHCSDLGGMPHLLVAGQTGSGKSVMVNCVIMSVLLRTTPDEVRLILVDPKTVELALYREVPHLLTPVITDMKKATNALKNATREMERRLQLLAQHGVRNISQFNEKVDSLQERREDREPESEPEKLPYVVVIVDELADLMMLAGRQVEESIQRLAQMARAVGIHLLLATQRPSVDVITGLIKANIPARLSFRLATRVDSRTILDSMGAESLLGKGDMLFLPPGTARRRRFHGPFVSEEEIEAVVSHWKDQAKPAYKNEYLESPDGDQEESEGDGDAGFDDPCTGRLCASFWRWARRPRPRSSGACAWDTGGPRASSTPWSATGSSGRPTAAGRGRS